MVSPAIGSCFVAPTPTGASVSALFRPYVRIDLPSGETPACPTPRLTAGEPWIFGIPEPGEREFLSKLGLELREALPLGGAESLKRYLTRSDGTPYIPIPTPQQQYQGQRGGYCLAEAVVPTR